MPKLTETTKDQLSRKSKPTSKSKKSNGHGRLHIEDAHEPISGESWQSDVWAAHPHTHALAKMADGPSAPPPAPSVVSTAPGTPVLDDPLRTPKVAIVGTAPSSRTLAPFNNPEWTIWVCSPGNMAGIPRIDAWFEIHGDILVPENRHYGENYVNWLKLQSFPVYMHEFWPTFEDGGSLIDLKKMIPTWRLFPHQDLIREFGRDFFSSSFAWMIAYAIKLGAKEIALYGVDMASRDEYILQRPGFYYFKNECRKRGIRISAPHESDIMIAPPLYGYSEVTPFARKLHARKREMQERISVLEGELKNRADNLLYLKGALEDIDYTINIHGGIQNNSD